jgi:hypothetical protein
VERGVDLPWIIAGAQGYAVCAPRHVADARFTEQMQTSLAQAR